MTTARQQINEELIKRIGEAAFSNANAIMLVKTDFGSIAYPIRVAEGRAVEHARPARRRPHQRKKKLARRELLQKG